MYSVKKFQEKREVSAADGSIDGLVYNLRGRGYSARLLSCTRKDDKIR